MSTSATDPTRRTMKRAAVTGASLALLCVVFTAVYERFSHGAVSSHMRCMFLMPLVGCALPALILYLLPPRRAIGRPAFNLWNSGLAAWVVGCLFRGIVNISGRYTDLDKIYWALGWCLLAAALTWELLSRIVPTHSRKEVTDVE